MKLLEFRNIVISAIGRPGVKVLSAGMTLETDDSAPEADIQVDCDDIGFEITIVRKYP